MNKRILVSLMISAGFIGGGGGYAATPTITTGITVSGSSTDIKFCAPFGIVFSGVTTTYSNPAVKPFHELIYFWDFGDTGCTNYTNGELAGKTRNVFVGGPVVPHVYETPGSYTCQMWAWDGTTMHGPATQAVTVSNPDTLTEYQTTGTVCISSTAMPMAGVGGVPAGAICDMQSDLYYVMTTYAFSNKRILFKSGDPFTCSAQVYKNCLNLYLGTYGGTAPATINAGAAGVTFFLPYANSGNPANNPDSWRIVNFAGTNTSGYSACRFYSSSMVTDVAGDAGIKTSTKGRITMHKCSANNLSYGASAGSLSTVISLLTITSVYVGGGNLGIWFASALYGGVVDSSIDNNHGGEHCIRNQGGDYCSFVSNTLLRPAASKTYMALRGWGVSTPANGVVSQFRVAAYNRFDSSTRTVDTSQYTQIAPQNNTTNEPIEDVIWEGNYYHQAGGSTRLWIQGQRITVRNNITNRDSTANGVFIDLWVENQYMPTYPTRDIYIYNNTDYGPGTGGAGFLNLNSTNGPVVGASIYNVYNYGNLVYLPNCTKDGNGNGTGPFFYPPNSQRSVGGSDLFNSTDHNISAPLTNMKTTNPLFVGPLTSAAGFALQSGSPYKGVTAADKVLIDALQVKRYATHDVGAVIAL